MPPTNSRSDLHFFRFLPSEIVTDILSRLPTRTIVTCKCVCRSWRDLLRSRQFADFHLSKSVPGLVIGPRLNTLKDMKFVELDDELGLQHYDLPLTRVKSEELTESAVLPSSPNGLLLLHRCVPGKKDALHICNPNTREYIKLPYDRLLYSSFSIHSYGFGVSRMSRRHKVVRIYHEGNRRVSDRLGDISMSVCLVYTLGTVRWRSVKPPPPFVYDYLSAVVYLNGNLHWLVRVMDGSDRISCFDLETEAFSMLSLPESKNFGGRSGVCLVALGDCICACRSTVEVIDIWLMKEYGDDKSWVKEFVIGISPDLFTGDFVRGGEVVHPVKIFKNGDILMVWQNWRKMFMIYYSKKTETTERIEVFKGNVFTPETKMVMPHTPSFFSLKSFTKECVRRF